MNDFQLTYNEAAYGSNKPLPTFEKLQAGDITLEYGEGSIRYIKIGDTEILRMIYFAVRNHNWDTIPLEITEENIDVNDDAFSINFKGTCVLNDIDFAWDCYISGNSKNKLIFEIKGKANSAFQKNRVGFCVLHPVAECQGIPCKVTAPDGAEAQYLFPKNISPHQPMQDMRKMEWMPADTINASLLMEGDIFEMEDQRNWTDDSYKTYCTPLALPFPAKLHKGDTVNQTITLAVENTAGKLSDDMAENTVQFHYTGEKVAMPNIGIGASSAYQTLSDSVIGTIKQIPFHHYRIDIDFADKAWETKLMEGKTCANKLGTKLSLALFYSQKAIEEIESLAKVLGEFKSKISTIYIFDKQSKTTPDSLIDKVIQLLHVYFPNTTIGAGTNAYFTELNRERVDTAQIDLLTYSVNPQVHAFDNDSLTETLQAQQYTVESTQQFSGGLPVHISPITLRPRFNPNATGAEPAPKAGELPSQTDYRQMSLFAASWLVGSIRYLAAAKCQQFTYFETAGTRGIVQGEDPPLLPNKFKSFAGAVFPVYHVLKFILGYLPKEVAVFKSSLRLKSELLIAMNEQGEKRGIITNFCQESLRVNIQANECLTGEVKFLIVQPENVNIMMHEPDYLAKSNFEIYQPVKGNYQFELPAFGLIFLM